MKWGNWCIKVPTKSDDHPKRSSHSFLSRFQIEPTGLLIRAHSLWIKESNVVVNLKLEHPSDLCRNPRHSKSDKAKRSQEEPVQKSHGVFADAQKSEAI